MMQYGMFGARQIRRLADIFQVRGRKVRLVLLAWGWFGVAFVLGAPTQAPLTGPDIYEGFGPTYLSNAYERWAIYSAAILSRTDDDRKPIYQYYDVSQAFVAGYLARAEGIST